MLDEEESIVDTRSEAPSQLPVITRANSKQTKQLFIDFIRIMCNVDFLLVGQCHFSNSF